MSMPKWFELSLSYSNTVLTARETEAPNGVSFEIDIDEGVYYLYNVTFSDSGDAAPPTVTRLKSFPSFAGAFHMAKKLFKRTYGDTPLLEIAPLNHIQEGDNDDDEDDDTTFLVIVSRDTWKSYYMNRYAIWETE